MKYLIAILIMAGSLQAQVHSDFKMNYNDSWDFSAHDKQAHLLGGAWMESFVYARLKAEHGKMAHVPAFIISSGLGLIWEIKDGHVNGVAGDDAGFSKQDAGYVVMGAALNIAIDMLIPEMKEKAKGVIRKIPIVKKLPVIRNAE